MVVAASSAGQLLHHARAVDKNLNFPLEIFVENDSVELRFDLLETGIAICTQVNNIKNNIILKLYSNRKYYLKVNKNVFD